jgi:hypothetical protein
LPAWKKNCKLASSRISAIAFIAACALHAADPLYESAVRKLDAIEARQVKRGSTVTFSPQEINAWARVKIPEIVPEGMRDYRAELGNGTATGYAQVDFLKMRHAAGASTNWFLSKLIEGERPLLVGVKLESGGGRCIVYLTRVEIGKAVANKTVIDVLVKTFFAPLYPAAKINMPIYHPIDTGVPLQASASDLALFEWSKNGLIVDFILPADESHVLRVSFDRECIVRLLDEMALSTEDDDSAREGLVHENFAYWLDLSGRSHQGQANVLRRSCNENNLSRSSTSIFYAIDAHLRRDSHGARRRLHNMR